MSITCEPRVDQGLMRINGTTPNGNATITREVEGMPTVLLRGGARVISTGGIAMDDTEAPLGVPLTYRVAVSGISAADRVVQQNLMPTPTFLHGVQGWLAGSGAGRALSIVTDATAHSSSVGLFAGSTVTTAPPAVPTLIGHVDSTVFTNSTYTLTPPTTGGTAIATNDWMVLVHQQLASVAVSAPTVVGTGTWALVDDVTNGTIRQLVWTRKRSSADQTAVQGYGVTVTNGAAAIGTLLWIRGGTQDETVKAVTRVVIPPQQDLFTSTVAVPRPHLTLSFMSAVTATTGIPSDQTDVTGGTWVYTRGTGVPPRTLVVIQDSNANAGYTQQTNVHYDGDNLLSGIATQISFQVAASLSDRIIARGKITALAASTRGYVLTGRVRFNTTALNDWQDIKTFGTWQQVKTTKGTWLGTRGSASTSTDDFLSLFVSIVDPITGADYITPQQIYSVTGSRLNTWIDFAALLPVVTNIPATAEVRLFHGTNVREYGTDFYLDEFGITPYGQFFDHPSLYWFDGDTPVPANPAQYSQPGFVADSSDASIVWTGTAGNSISLFTGPSAMHAVTTCQLDASDTARLLPCEPVLLSDPVNVTLASWLGLIHIDALTHPSKQTIHQIINRAAPLAISQVRGWETGSITVLTMDTDQRNQILNVIRSGRVLLLRNPIPDYPENNWFLALGDITEDRPVPNQRVTIREWTLPFVRVERPTGLLEATSGVTWQSVADSGSWQHLRDTAQDWLAVLAGDSVS